MARVLFVLLVAALCLAPVVAQQPTFRAGTDLTTFGVTVLDKRSTFLTDLAAADFELLEDGKRQEVRLFARGEAEGTAPELHIGLLFDTSGSMGEDITLARSAAIKFLNTLTDAADMTLVDFDTEVRVARFTQANFPRLVERIRTRKPSGMTAMYDALGVYLDEAEEDEGRTILVVFTDGGDTRSTIRFADAMTLVKASDVTIYTIGFLQNQTSTGRREQQLSLTQLATETGGQAFFPVSMKQIEEAYAKIVAQIRAQYTLGYVSSNPATDGRWRKVEVRVSRDGLKDVRVLSRKGYFAPWQPPASAAPAK